MLQINQDKIADIIRDVAADKIVPRFRALEEGDIRAKTSPTDLVTIADEEAEIELTRILKDYLPGSEVVGEEAVSSERMLRDVLTTHDGPVWVVDPVDGTGNFARGEEIFGTMVALVHKGERVMSWIYQVTRDRMISAERGAGVVIGNTQFNMDGVKRAGADDNFSTMKAFVSRKFIPPHMRPHVDKQTEQLKDASTYMCCAFEYVELLEGAASFSLYKRIEPWDHLAGVLFLEEAGFYIRKWDGSPYAVGDLSGGLINAPSEGLWSRVHETFIEGPLKAAKSG